jgi:hypothetical protein
MSPSGSTTLKGYIREGGRTTDIDKMRGIDRDRRRLCGRKKKNRINMGCKLNVIMLKRK